MLEKISIAPMMNVTDRHFRVFLRGLSGRMKLYTEMKVSGAIIHGNRERFLDFDECERPLAIQLGGSQPKELAVCARLAEEWGYDEINLNIGCPSERVKNGKFGACLMAQPKLVAECVAAMRGEVRDIPVTVKTRIGIDHHDSYEYLAEFIARVAEGGCEHFIIHARKAWLKGLSPKENRELPPLHYDRVYRLKQDFPALRIAINGGIKTLSEASEHLRHVDSVMIGREAIRHPWLLSAVDEVIFNQASTLGTRTEMVDAYLPYIEQQLALGSPLRHMIQPVLGLFHGQPGARSWRRHLSVSAANKGAGVEVIQQALRMVDAEVDADADADADAETNSSGNSPAGNSSSCQKVVWQAT